MSFLYLIIVLLALIAYVFFFYVVAYALWVVLYVLLSFNKKDREEFSFIRGHRYFIKLFFSRTYQQYLNPKLLLKIGVSVSVLILAIYVQQRVLWHEEKSSTAKEYFYTGQVLSIMRGILPVHVEETVLFEPLRTLQRKIYQEGIIYLPEKSGDEGVWRMLWFSNHYVQKDMMPSGTNMFEHSEKMAKILDECWLSMTLMNEGLYESEKMKEEYLRRFFPMAFYYTRKNGYYCETYFDSRKIRYASEFHVKRSEMLIKWLLQARELIEKDKGLKEFLNNKFSIRMAYVMAQIENAVMVIDNRILNQQFTCDSKYVKLYTKSREDAINTLGINQTTWSWWKRDKSKKERLYDDVVNTALGRFHGMMLKEKCQINVAGQKGDDFGQDRMAKAAFKELDTAN